MKQLRDYTPFYLGCEVLAYTTFKDGDTGQEVTIELNKALLGVGIDGEIRLSGTIKAQTFKFKLRPLSDMSNEEKIEVDRLYTSKGLLVKSYAEVTKYLLSKQFDLFSLIDAGLAIDRTKLNSELSDERSVASKDSQITNAD